MFMNLYDSFINGWNAQIVCLLTVLHPVPNSYKCKIFIVKWIITVHIIATQSNVTLYSSPTSVSIYL